MFHVPWIVPLSKAVIGGHRAQVIVWRAVDNLVFSFNKAGVLKSLTVIACNLWCKPLIQTVSLCFISWLVKGFSARSCRCVRLTIFPRTQSRLVVYSQGKWSLGDVTKSYLWLSENLDMYDHLGRSQTRNHIYHYHGANDVKLSWSQSSLAHAGILTLNVRGTELFRFNIVNIIVVDGRAPCVARASAPMILTM